RLRSIKCKQGSRSIISKDISIPFRRLWRLSLIWVTSQYHCAMALIVKFMRTTFVRFAATRHYARCSMNGPDPDTLVVLGSTLQFNPVDLRNGTSNARATGNRKFAIDDVVGQEQSQLHNIRVVIA